jgi:uncharacterized protein YjeT (DUF2065 family)
MSDDFLRAFALLLVMEGLLPFLSPARFRESLLRAASIGDKPLRLLGFAALVGGALLLHFTKVPA